MGTKGQNYSTVLYVQTVSKGSGRIYKTPGRIRCTTYSVQRILYYSTGALYTVHTPPLVGRFARIKLNLRLRRCRARLLACSLPSPPSDRADFSAIPDDDAGAVPIPSLCSYIVSSDTDK